MIVVECDPKEDTVPDGCAERRIEWHSRARTAMESKYFIECVEDIPDNRFVSISHHFLLNAHKKLAVDTFTLVVIKITKSMN